MTHEIMKLEVNAKCKKVGGGGREHRDCQIPEYGIMHIIHWRRRFIEQFFHLFNSNLYLSYYTYLSTTHLAP